MTKRSTALVHSRRRNSGAALIVSLVLLIIMMVGGIAAMRGTSLNEKATSNQRNKTISLMAAESGVQAFHQWFRTNVNSANWPTTTATKNAWQTSIPSSASPVSNSGIVGDFGYFWVDPAVVWGPTSSKTVSIKVTGHALSPTGSVLATTRINIEFQIPGLNLIPSMPIAPIGIAANITSFNPSNSNNFSVQGGSGPAIATINAASDNVITTALNGPGAKPNTYTGTNPDGTPCTSACVESNLGSPWNDFSFLKSTIDSLTAKAVTNPDQVQVFTGNTTFGSGGERLNNSTAPLSPPVTVVIGNVEFKNGVDYSGLVIIVGNTVDITGGGGSIIRGGVMMINRTINADGSWSIASGAISISGGGGMTIIYDSNPNGIASSESAFKSWEEE